MVAKISTGGNMFGALAYNQNKVDSGEAKVLFSNRMLLGEDGNFSIGECMRSFEMQMPVQLSTKKPILHISMLLWIKKLRLRSDFYPRQEQGVFRHGKRFYVP
jgi:hypothetical protein